MEKVEFFLATFVINSSNIQVLKDVEKFVKNPDSVIFAKKIAENVWVIYGNDCDLNHYYADLAEFVKHKGKLYIFKIDPDEARLENQNSLTSLNYQNWIERILQGNI